MQTRERQAIVIALLASDLTMLLWATAMALGVRYGISAWPGGTGSSASGLALIISAVPITMVLMAAGRLYRPDELFSGHREYGGVIRACTFAAFAVLLLAFLLDADVSRGALILTWWFSSLLVSLERFFFRRAVFRLRRSGRLTRNALIVGADEHALAIARQLSAGATGWRVLGFLDDYRPVGTELLPGLRVVGDPREAAELAESIGASDLIVVPHAVSWEAQRDLLEMAATCDQPVLRLAPGFYHLLAAGARPSDANFVPLLTPERLRITGLDAGLKRLLDYGVSLALALPAAGLVGAHWLAGRLSGGGPTLLRQHVLGLRGQPFHLLILARPSGLPPDRGLRRRAWHLRATLASERLAKLPNVLNILAGHMSLVGPRALISSADIRQYPWLRTLFMVRPGLTGPRVANGDGWTLEEQALRDVAYVREYSLWLDLRLLFTSVTRLLRREQALPASYNLAPAEEPFPAETMAG